MQKAPPKFSPQEDATILRLRAQSVRWTEVAKAIHRAPNAVRVHGYALLGQTPPGRAPCIRASVRPIIIADDREPLPAGHPASWGAITAGTTLEGSAYAF